MREHFILITQTKNEEGVFQSKVCCYKVCCLDQIVKIPIKYYKVPNDCFFFLNTFA